MINTENSMNFIKAIKPEGLRKLMVQKNINDGIIYSYQIIFDGKFWYAWFNEKIDKVLEDSANGTINS